MLCSPPHYTLVRIFTIRLRGVGVPYSDFHGAMMFNLQVILPNQGVFEHIISHCLAGKIKNTFFDGGFIEFFLEC